MSETPQGRAAVGGRAPPCFGMDAGRGFFALQALRGCPAVLILIGSRAAGQGLALLAALLPHLPALTRRDAALACITEGNPAAVLPPDLPVQAVDGGDFLARCGVAADDTVVMLLDRAGRIVLVSGLEEPDVAGACLRCLDHLPAPTPPEEAPLLRELSDPLAIGQKLPPCFGMTQDRRFYSTEQQYGRAAVMLLIGPDADPSMAAAFRDLPDARADLRLITLGNPARLVALAPPPVLAVDAGDFLGRCGLGAREVRLLVVDRNQRIALHLVPEPGMDIAGRCLAALDALPTEAPRAVVAPAPALVLPNLLPPAMCRYLIQRFESGPSSEGGVARMDEAGRVGNVVDPAKKRRRDMRIEPGTDLHAALRETLLRRCGAEILKAFHCRVAFMDRILIARYDDTGGWFRRHRDNEADNVAFREFALSLNLNTGEYGGGHLLFPEYNDHRHEPPAGAGMVFSTSVLHEAAPVTAGRRYVLLTFLHGEAAEARRLAWEHQKVEACVSPR